jgi:nitronate monooxygenase
MEHIETAITKMLGIQYPIIAAPMFIVSNPDMVVNVSEAGGLGTMPALNARTTDDLVKSLRDIKSRTDKPYAINFMLIQNPRVEEDWAVLMEEKVPVIITSLGNPTEYIKQAHDRGLKVFCDVVNLRHAEKATQAGADALIAVSAGAGGHAGPIVANILIPWLKKHFDIPIIAAGGLATGQGLASMLALGASAGYYGTRFITSTENKFTPEFKQMIIDSGPEDIVNSAEITGHPANFLKQSLADYKKLGDQAKSWKDAWSAGQTVALIDEVKPCTEIVAELVQEYKQALRSLPQATS